MKQAGGGALDDHAATASFDERGFRLEVAPVRVRFTLTLTLT